jgi:hypothetical protein
MAAGLVSNIADGGTLTIWSVLSITTQLTMRVLLAPLAVHHACISCEAA